LRWREPNAARPFKGQSLKANIENGCKTSDPFTVWLPIAFFFLVAAVFCALAFPRISKAKSHLGVFISVGGAIPAPFEWQRRYSTSSILPVRIIVSRRAITFPCLHLRRYCLVGIGVMAVGIVYWAAWRIILPRVLGYELVPRKETLQDGTVVKLVSVFDNPSATGI
jgi:hypothetical protein